MHINWELLPELGVWISHLTDFRSFPKGNVKRNSLQSPQRFGQQWFFCPRSWPAYCCSKERLSGVALGHGQKHENCSVVSHNSVVKNSTWLNNIWQMIRQHFGFQFSGVHISDWSNITLQSDDRQRDLYQRLIYINDFFAASRNIYQHEGPVTVVEDLGRTLQDNIVVLWLKLIHRGPIQLVKQLYNSSLSVSI